MVLTYRTDRNTGPLGFRGESCGAFFSKACESCRLSKEAAALATPAALRAVQLPTRRRIVSAALSELCIIRFSANLSSTMNDVQISFDQLCRG